MSSTVWTSYGFSTAVAIATEALDRLQATAASHDRLLILEVMGRDAGHIALAAGIETFKMHHEHRGLNHPVKNLENGLSEITSQNHGFAVSMDSLKSSDVAELTHIDLNDETVEGLKLKGKPAFSVQYHPESSPGPHDSTYLFDDFIKLIKEHKK